MRRDHYFNTQYFNETYLIYCDITQHKLSLIKEKVSFWESSQNSLLSHYYSLIFLSYSKRENISVVNEHFHEYVEYFVELKLERLQQKKPIWRLYNWNDFSAYSKSFQVIGLAICLNVSDEIWKKVLYLTTEPSIKDSLLDRVIATREKNWKVGKYLKHQMYEPLLLMFENQENSLSLREFVENWHSNYVKCYTDEIKCDAFFHRNPNHLKKPSWRSYYGFWCIEAVTMAKILNIDDRLCWNHEDYPCDLIQENGFRTHPIYEEKELEIEIDEHEEKEKEEQRNDFIFKCLVLLFIFVLFLIGHWLFSLGHTI